IPAAWTTTSHPAKAAASASTSSMSTPVRRETTTVSTGSRRAARLRPTNPVPPVIAMRIPAAYLAKVLYCKYGRYDERHLHRPGASDSSPDPARPQRRRVGRRRDRGPLQELGPD